MKKLIVNKEILVFRTDRIGDLLLTCPTIKTIKQSLPGHKITIITSDKNYLYSKTFDFFDNIYVYPKKNILKKIKLFVKLYKKKFDKIFIFDGKDRSILLSCLLKSKSKTSKVTTKKQSYLCKLFRIKYSFDVFGKNLNEVHQKLLNYAGIEDKIANFDYLKSKKDNFFASKIPFSDYIHIHLDEKWFSSTYIKSYENINPGYEEFINFVNKISDKNNTLITTGLKKNNLIDLLEINALKKIHDNIHINNYKNNIAVVIQPTFLDLESILRRSKILITCHGAITHVAASLNVKIFDIVEKSSDKLVSRYSLYINNYYKLYRKSFKYLVQDLNQLL